MKSIIKEGKGKKFQRSLSPAREIKTNFKLHLDSYSRHVSRSASQSYCQIGSIRRRLFWAASSCCSRYSRESSSLIAYIFESIKLYANSSSSSESRLCGWLQMPTNFKPAPSYIARCSVSVRWRAPRLAISSQSRHAAKNRKGACVQTILN